jgi:hypothetical protein
MNSAVPLNSPTKTDPPTETDIPTESDPIYERYKGDLDERKKYNRSHQEYKDFEANGKHLLARAYGDQMLDISLGNIDQVIRHVGTNTVIRAREWFESALAKRREHSKRYFGSIDRGHYDAIDYLTKLIDAIDEELEPVYQEKRQKRNRSRSRERSCYRERSRSRERSCSRERSPRRKRLCQRDCSRQRDRSRRREWSYDRK